MKIIKFTAYLLYRYYSKHGFARDMPYLTTISVLTLLFFIHICQIFILFNITYLIPTDGSQLKIENYFKMGLFMLPIGFLFSFLIKKEELITDNYNDKTIKKGYMILIAYFILSFAFLMFLAFLKKGKFG